MCFPHSSLRPHAYFPHHLSRSRLMKLMSSPPSVPVGVGVGVRVIWKEWYVTNSQTPRSNTTYSTEHPYHPTTFRLASVRSWADRKTSSCWLRFVSRESSSRVHIVFVFCPCSNTRSEIEPYHSTRTQPFDDSDLPVSNFPCNPPHWRKVSWTPQYLWKENTWVRNPDHPRPTPKSKGTVFVHRWSW